MISYDKLIKNVNLDWIIFFNENKEELINIINEIKNLKFYPLEKNIFRALIYISVKDIKLVILGQDPYIQ